MLVEFFVRKKEGDWCCSAAAPKAYSIKNANNKDGTVVSSLLLAGKKIGEIIFADFDEFEDFEDDNFSFSLGTYSISESRLLSLYKN